MTCLRARAQFRFPFLDFARFFLRKMAMRYQGGKVRVGKAVAEALAREERKWAEKLGLTPPLPYLEPFAGMLGVMRYMGADGKRKRVGSDINQDVIAMWKSAQGGWRPPQKCTQADWQRARDSAKRAKTASPLRGFLGSQASFGGAFFSGYVGKYDAKADPCRQGRKSLEKILPEVQDVRLYSLPYQDFEPRGYLIYADPPYDTPCAKYGPNRYMSAFDFEQFWRTMERWSKHNLVYVSEFKAPKGWRTVWKQPVNRGINPRKRTDYGYGTHRSVERLFFYGPPNRAAFANPTLGLKRTSRPYDNYLKTIGQGKRKASPQATRRNTRKPKTSPRPTRRRTRPSKTRKRANSPQARKR